MPPPRSARIRSGRTTRAKNSTELILHASRLCMLSGASITRIARCLFEQLPATRQTRIGLNKARKFRDSLGRPGSPRIGSRKSQVEHHEPEVITSAKRVERRLGAEGSGVPVTLPGRLPARAPSPDRNEHPSHRPRCPCPPARPGSTATRGSPPSRRCIHHRARKRFSKEPPHGSSRPTPRRGLPPPAAPAPNAASSPRDSGGTEEYSGRHWPAPRELRPHVHSAVRASAGLPSLIKTVATFVWQFARLSL